MISTWRPTVGTLIEIGLGIAILAYAPSIRWFYAYLLVYFTVLVHLATRTILEALMIYAVRLETRTISVMDKVGVSEGDFAETRSRVENSANADELEAFRSALYRHDMWW